MDCQRVDKFKRRISSFKLGKSGQFHKDIQSMRKKTEDKMLRDLTRIRNQHPWYQEFMNKVVNLAGSKEHSVYEKELIDFIIQ